MLKRKNNKYLLCLLIFISTLSSNLSVSAQSSVIHSYLEVAADYASVYRGEIEYFYNPYVYKSQPYYISSEFTEGDLYYKNRYYPNVKLRLDTFKDQLMILNPRNNSVILNAENVLSFKVHGKDIIRHVPSENSGLSAGYYLLLYKGDQLTVLGKERNSRVVLSTQVEFDFSTTTRYYVVLNGQYYTVRNKRSFARLFPEFKKKINKFAKDNRLDFRNSREFSLAQMGAYCDELLNNKSR